MLRVLIGTTNPAKERYVSDMLAGLPIETFGPTALSKVCPGVDETGGSFEDNARLKAVAHSQIFDEWVISTDGGLEIPVLGERWNKLLTGRFAGNNASDIDKITALIQLVKNYKREERLCYFTEAVAVARHGKIAACWSVKSSPGYIADTWRYDPRLRGMWIESVWADKPGGVPRLADTETDALINIEIWSPLRDFIRGFFLGELASRLGWYH